MNNRIPEVDFGRREIKYGRDAEGNETEGLEVSEGSPLEIVIDTYEKGRGGKSCVEGREWPIVWTVNELA